MRDDASPRERAIEQIGEIDRDIFRHQQQIVALKARRFDLVLGLDDRSEDTIELEPVTEGSYPPVQQPAWSQLMNEIGPPRTGEIPQVQLPLRARSAESYTPVKIYVSDLVDGLRVRQLRHEINAPVDALPPQNHLHYSGSRSRYDVALCGARAQGEFGWWTAYPDEHGEIQLCLSCLTEMRS